MSAQTHPAKRQSTYYFRAKVPADLRTAFGRAEVKYSLKARDFQAAKQLARQASAEFDQRCAALRAQQTVKAPDRFVLTDASIQGICDLWRYHALAGDEYSRQEGLFSDAFEDQVAQRLATREVLTGALQRGRLERVKPALQTFLHLLGIELSGDESRYRGLLYRFRQTVTEVHDRQVARDKGEVVWTSEPPVTPVTASAVPAAGGPDLDELFDDWRRFAPRRPQRTVDDVRRVVDDFHGLVDRKGAATAARRALRTHLAAQYGSRRRSRVVWGAAPGRLGPICEKGGWSLPPLSGAVR